MNISFVPNLQMIACVQVAVPVLDLPDMRYLTHCCSSDSQFSENIEKVILEKILSLVLAPAVQKMLRNCIMNMLSQIIDCKNTYALILTDYDTHVNQYFTFFWKLDGTIDQKKTVKALIENQDLNIKERFVLACSYCLVDDIQRLWNRMVETHISFTQLELECCHVVKLWIEILEKHSSCKTITDEILESPVLQQNVFMMRHVFQMLPRKKQHLLLLSTALKGDATTDVLGFCCSHLNSCDQEKIFKKSPVKVLQCVFTWPYQFLLTSVASQLWIYLSCQDFIDIMRSILQKMMNQVWQNFTLIQLLKEFWLESPIHFKEHIKRQAIFGPLMIVLTCDMHRYPRHELRQAYVKYLEKILHAICPL